ncbi:YlaH-like family protein [Sutcliffiella cohnii]|uniref:YlaH-like family protein n=1 Tax=Sutcliffiella TaxID=2837511 RepID=UPI0022DD0BEF|nr:MULTISPECIES: YlaH-like family protein [Sutcliffiella]MED4015486.1 YlaH-like family protein [Sutcliffiella cohnii]WBL13430.1 YlaH-like family protein [Sutcliffiella sp. NC1]
MEDVVDRLSPFAKMFRVDQNPELGMWLLFITIFLLSVLVYKLGFALKLPILKSAIIYLFLFFGSTVLTFLAIQLPVAEGLVVAALILIIYKIRLHNSKKAEEA